ncbi:MAG: hypothetical protein Q8P77_01250 [Candidatus Veblenbacteria bacterium]|nr:hypothetical protein [Candidatus Veblenbacteria bacterium]
MLCSAGEHFGVKALGTAAAVILLLGAGELWAQTSNCTPATLPCPSLDSTVSITIGGSPGGGGGSSGNLPREVTDGDVVIKGYSAPGSIVTILRDGTVAASFITPIEGRFERTLTIIPAGIHTFALFAIDQEAHATPTVALSVSVAGGTVTTIADLVMPPTLWANPAATTQGSPVALNGFAAPGAEVFIALPSGLPVLRATAAGSGRFSASFDTSVLSLGVYVVRGYARLSGGLLSEFSSPVRVVVLPAGTPPEVIPTEPSLPPGEEEEVRTCARGDLSNDSHVNLTDFSILIYWWGSVNQCADQNGDGSVNLTDLSILLYWWTG